MRDARNELVRIDDRGEAHPIGAIASQRMRARQGAFRLLPAPPHVVLMRYTGEDGRRDEGDGAIIRLGGEITRPGAMVEIFGLVAQSGWRGELAVFDGEHDRSLFFEQGNVVGAVTSADEERLGRIMYRYGGITQSQLMDLLREDCPQRRLGNRAVERGWVSQENVFGYLRKQIQEIVHSTLLAYDGTFFFLDGFDEARLSSRQVISASALLMDGVTRLDEIRYFREKIPSSEYVPQKNPANDTQPGEEFRGTYSAIDGERSIEQLGRDTGLGEFAITRDVYALMRSNHVQLSSPKMSGGLRAIGVLANDALRRIHQVVDSEGKGTELREGLASFASGAGVYDILFRSAGPDDRGQFEAERISENVTLVSDLDPELTLRQMLYEYVGFALFSAGALVDEEGERTLKGEVSPIISRLQPPG